jgi:hypothetical protein
MFVVRATQHTSPSAAGSEPRSHRVVRSGTAKPSATQRCYKPRRYASNSALNASMLLPKIAAKAASQGWPRPIAS